MVSQQLAVGLVMLGKYQEAIESGRADAVAHLVEMAEAEVAGLMCEATADQGCGPARDSS